MKKRYQECNIFVKLYRRIRYQIPCIVNSTWHYLYNRDKLLFKVHLTEWQIKARWYYTFDELKFKIFGRAKNEDFGVDNTSN
jgi:hypothetical protein